MNKREELAERFGEELLFLAEPEFDEALIGVVTIHSIGPVALYDENRIITILMREGMTYEEAIEHFDYNISGSYMGEFTPAFATLIEEDC